MAELPPIVMLQDVQNPTLLVRLLRNLSEKVTSITNKIDLLARTVSFPSFSQIRNELLAGGSAPLNINGLRGITGDAQPASALRYSAAPTGQTLQNLRDTQLITVGTTSAGFDLYTTIGGNPNKLFKLIGGAAGGNMMTTDTAQTATSSATKVWQGKQTFADPAGSILIKPTSAPSSNTKILEQQTNGGTSLSWLNSEGVLTLTGQFGARVYNTANQSISDSVITALTFDSESFDRGSCHSTSSNTSRITIPTGGAGLWLLIGQIQYASNATGVRLASIYANGATLYATTQLTALSGNVTSIPVSTVINVVDGDFFELSSYQTSGGALDAVAGVGKTWFLGFKLC